MTLKIVLGVFIAIAAFVAWRYTSVARGARARDESLLRRLDPLGQRLERSAEVRPDEIQRLAASPELRPYLHSMLTVYQQLQLFPSQFLSQEAHAESALVYWLLHPNELEAAPSALELVDKVERQVSGRQGTFYVFRYKMPTGHWAGSEWLLGLAGPFFSDDTPYRRHVAGFARAGDHAGKVTATELVDSYLSLFKGPPMPRDAEAPNQRLKLSRCGGRLKGNGLVLIAAAAPRSLSAIR